MRRYYQSFIPIVVLLVLMLAPSARAGEMITLQESLDRTVEYSRQVLIANEGINTAEGFYIEQRAAAFPKIDGEVKALHAYDKSLEDLGGKAESNAFSASASLSQPLFTWGQIGAAVRAAKFDMKSAEQRVREARQLAMRQAATGFFDLLLTYELEKAARDRVAQRQRHLDETERRHQMDVSTDYDVLSARVSLTNARPGLTRAENDIRLAKDRLRYYMGIEGDFEVSGSLTCQLKTPLSLGAVLEEAKANRPEIAYYENRVGVFKELIKVAKGGNKPRVDLKANAGYSEYEDLGGYPGARWDAGLYLTMPLFDGFQTKGKVIQAKSQLSTTELEMKQLLDNIALEAREAINGVQEAVEIAKGLEATTNQAEKLLEMAENGYRQGVKTKLDVDDAESNLLASRINLASARRDYLNAQVKLLWIMGKDLHTALTNPEYLPVCR